MNRSPPICPGAVVAVVAVLAGSLLQGAKREGEFRQEDGGWWMEEERGWDGWGGQGVQPEGTGRKTPPLGSGGDLGH